MELSTHFSQGWQPNFDSSQLKVEKNNILSTKNRPFRICPQSFLSEFAYLGQFLHPEMDHK